MLTIHFFTGSAQQITASNACNRASHLLNPGHSRGMVDLHAHSKTVALPIGAHAKSVCLASPVKIEGQSIQLSDVHKHLGVYLSGSLSWSPHFSSVISKGTKRVGLLHHMACKLSPELVTKLYLSFVRPILEYASLAWHFSISASEALALERIQASVARKVLRADWLTPKATLLRQLNWPSLGWRRSVACLTLFHKLITEPSPPLSECLPPFSSEHSARQTRKPLQLALSRYKSSNRLKSFFPASAILWNTLPDNLQKLKNSNIFKKKLEHLWEKYRFCPDRDISFPLLLTLCSLSRPIFFYLLFLFIFYFLFYLYFFFFSCHHQCPVMENPSIRTSCPVG